MDHIGILSHRSVLDKILSGQKTVESRFSRLKSLPFGRIVVGDTIYFKLSGGPVLCKALVGNVIEFENLTPKQVISLAKQYENELAVSEDFITRKLESKYASLIFLEQIEECEPSNYKQDGRSGWIVLPPGTILKPILRNDEAKSISNIEDFRAISL